MRTREVELQQMSEQNKRILDKRRKKKLAKSDRRENIGVVDAVVSRYQCLETDDVGQFQSFSDFPLSKATLNGLDDSGFTVPTEIQRDSLLFSLRGVDVVGAAKTGSGKTLAFLIPMLECLWRQNWSRNMDGLGALVITPTRELAYQIFHILNKIGAHHQLSAALLIGGNDVTYEKARVGGVNIVISTPGRLLQHMDENSTFYCDQLQMLVIDEADRILDLGFAAQMNAILSNLPSERQTLLFSATQTKSVKELMRLALKDPVYVSVHENAPEATPSNLQQSYLVCADEDKINLLWSFLVNHRKRKSLIFVSSCKQARFLTKALCHLRPGLSLSGLWGTMKQSKRIEVFEKFNRRTFGAAMIATDVASRGLDFSRVDFVLQLDCPATVEDYIHRVGRTARMDAKGEAIVVFTSTQKEGMVRRLTEHKIPLNEIKVDQKKMYDISNKLQTMIIQFQELKSFAQQSFLGYVRSIYLMKYKDVFNVGSIDINALAKSYGLSATPRLRFLNRSAKNKDRRDNDHQYSSSAFTGEGRKSIAELVATLTKSSESANDELPGSVSSDNSDTDSFQINNMLRDSTVSNELSDVHSQSDSEDILKIKRRDVFNVLDDVPAESTERDLSSKKTVKLISRKAVAKKILRKGLRMNTRKSFTEDGDEIKPEGYDGRELSERKKFNLEEAMAEMPATDKLDKGAYREKLKKWRREKKAKLKKRLKEEELTSGGGAVLDLGDDGGSLDEEPDLSWLPDPDNPKKYDALWNEITDGGETNGEENGKIGSEDNDTRNVPITEPEEYEVEKKRKRRNVVANMEDEALKLLGYGT